MFLPYVCAYVFLCFCVCFLCENMCRPFYASGLEFIISRFAFYGGVCWISCLVVDMMF